MKKVLLVFFACLCSMSLSLFGQTAEDSITIVSSQWETNVSPDGIVHKRAAFTHLYKGNQYVNLIEVPAGKKLRYSIAVSALES